VGVFETEDDGVYAPEANKQSGFHFEIASDQSDDDGPARLAPPKGNPLLTGAAAAGEVR
jgi:hypothetical protein